MRNENSQILSAPSHVIAARKILCCITFCCLTATAGLARADESASSSDKTAGDDKTERCINLRSIKQTKVLDDQNILFYTNNNKNYKNHLPYPCSGLASANSFMYRTSESKLCNVDIITVLEKFGGNFTQGASCGLGVFEALDQQQLDELTKKPAKDH